MLGRRLACSRSWRERRGLKKDKSFRPQHRAKSQSRTGNPAQTQYEGNGKKLFNESGVAIDAPDMADRSILTAKTRLKTYWRPWQLLRGGQIAGTLGWHSINKWAERLRTRLLGGLGETTTPRENRESNKLLLSCKNSMLGLGKSRPKNHFNKCCEPKRKLPGGTKSTRRILMCKS